MHCAVGVLLLLFISCQGCPANTFWIVDRCCAESESKAGQQPVICNITDPWSSSVEPCPDGTYSMDSLKLSNRDRCHLKTSCNLPFMYYIHHGSRVHDAMCGCVQGYYITEAPHICMRNPTCRVGFGQDGRGGCIDCRLNGGYSDREDRDQPCLRHKNCHEHDEMEMCFISHGSSSEDAKCGPPTTDLSGCSAQLNATTAATEFVHTKSTTTTTTTTSSKPTTESVKQMNITGSVTDDDENTNIKISVSAVVVVIVVVIILVCGYLYRRLHTKPKRCIRKVARCRFQRERKRCKDDAEFRKKAMDRAIIVLPQHIGRDWQLMCPVLFDGQENRDTIPETVRIDSTAFGTETAIQNMLVKFKQIKEFDTDTIDVLYHALTRIRKGHHLARIFAPEDAEEDDDGEETSFVEENPV